MTGLLGLLDGLDSRGIGDDPEAVNDIVFVAHGRRGRLGFGLGKDGVDAAVVVGVKHEKLAGVGASVAKELETVGLGAGERVLVPKNNTGGVIFKLAGADETAADAQRVGAGDGVFL